MKKDIGARTVGLAILFLLLMSACLVPGISTAVPPSPAIMTGVMVTETSMPPPATITPRPTFTPTPPPEWVTSFSQPILDAIANRPPDFQDDFHDKSGGWQSEEWCGNRMEFTDGEFVITDCRVFRYTTNYSDFVIEFDGRFYSGAADNDSWGFAFRDTSLPGQLNFPGGPSHSIIVFNNGHVEINMDTRNGTQHQEFREAAYLDTQANHLLLIGKGSRFAFFVNGSPLYFIEDSFLPSGNFKFSAGNFAAAFDNFKIWDISDLP